MSAAHSTSSAPTRDRPYVTDDASPGTPPPELICPISRDIFELPVTIPETGCTYDEQSLLAWLNISATCPLTRKPARRETLTVNTQLHEQVTEWKKANGVASADFRDGADVSSREAPRTPAQLVLSLSRATHHQERVPLLQRLQDVAWHGEASKVSIARAGGIPTLLECIAPTASSMHMETQWHAAEVLSLLALVDQLRDDILDASCPSEDPHQTRQQRLDAALRSHLDALTTQHTCPRALWLLWVLSLDAGLRAKALTEASLIPVLANALTRPDATAFAALRVVRSLALVDVVGVLHAGGVVSAAISLLTTPLDDGDSSTDQPGTEHRMVAMAACSALCNATGGHHGVPADAGARASAMRCVQSMLHQADSPHMQGWAARLVRVVGATWTNGWQLCKVQCSKASKQSGFSMTAALGTSFRQHMMRSPQDAGVLPALLHVMGSEHDLPRVTACSALHALTEVAPGARASMVQQGAVALLAGAVQSRHYPLRFLAARTLAEIACPASSGAWRTVVHTVEHSNTVYVALLLVLQILLVLLREHTEQSPRFPHCFTPGAFRCPAVIAALERLLQDGCEHCQYCATVCLLNTSAAAAPGASCLVLQHVEAATLRGLLRLLSSTNSHYRCAAAAVLRQLVRVEANRPYMVKVGVVHALLEVVVGDAGRSSLEAASALQHLARMGSFYRNVVMDAAQATGKVGGVMDGLVGQLYTSRSS